jgi:hypothetical protein
MTDSHAAHHGAHGTAARPLPFSAVEWNEFRKSDVKSGGVIIALMTAIFTIGLTLYATIAYIVAIGNT